MRSNLSLQKGFTLIELLVASGILGLMITGLITILMQQQRQFNLTSQGIDVDQTGRTAIDFISSQIRNLGARQGKSVALQFFNGGSDPDLVTFCDDNSPKTGQNSPPDCIKIFTWDIADGQFFDTTTGKTLTEFPSTPESVLASLNGSDEIEIDVSNWFDDGLISTDPGEKNLIGFWSRGALCDPADPTGIACLTNPGDCTECAAILRLEELNTGTKRGKVITIADVISQNFQTSDFTDLPDFFNSFFKPRISSLSSEMTLVKSQAFAIRTTTHALVIKEDEEGDFVDIAGGEITVEGEGFQVGPGIVDLQFVFNLQDPDGGITKVGMPFDDDEDVRQFPDFTTVSSAGSLPYNGDMRGRQKDIRAIEIYIVVRSRLTPQLISGGKIPVKDIQAIGDVSLRPTSHSSLGEGFIYKIFNTLVYVRNLGREEFG